MKKILLLIASLFLVTACGQQAAETETQTGTTDQTETQTGVTTSVGTGAAIENGSQTSLYYILRDTDEKGKIIDGNMDAEGKPTGTPFTITVGATPVVAGFEKALIGMRAGETKTVSVAPEDGYGTGNITRETYYEDIAPVFSITQEKSLLEGKVTREMNIADIQPDFIKQYIDGKKTGDTITEEEGTVVKLVSRTDSTITFEFHNTSSPFYNKKLAVGSSETTNGITFKVTKIDGDKVTLEVTNTNSPFTGKNFVVGATAETEVNGQKITYKILAINEASEQKTVTLEETNTNPLANKTLYFTIKVDSVTPPTTPSVFNTIETTESTEVSTGTTTN